MLDLYSKSVLTVIAVALVIIAWDSIATKPAIALGDSCGGYRDPCQVTVTNLGEIGEIKIDTPIFGLPVQVQNWPR